MRILVAESEPLLAHQMKTNLSQDGYVVDVASDGAEAVYLGETTPFSLMIVDQALPVKDGVSVIKALRGQGVETPVLYMTASNDWQERVDGFDAGADDCVTKPFHLEELSARVRAAIRRKSVPMSPVFSKANVSFDARINQAMVAGTPVNLTQQEIAILSYLFHNAGRLVSQTELSEHIYHANGDRDSNTIAVFVSRLRKKLGDNVIETVRGRGYVIKPAI